MLKFVYFAFALFILYLILGYIVSLAKKNSPEPGIKDAKGGNRQVDPAIYDADYYLHAYSGDLKDYLSKLENLPIPLRRCLQYADPRPNENVLDLGCGKGHLSYFCALKGCRVTAIDYSQDAVLLAQKTRDLLPENLRNSMLIKKADFKELDTNEKYDVIFMADLIEHLYDWELDLLFNKVKKILKPQKGRLIIHTAPNRAWINIIFPLKRILDWPNTLRKGKDFYYRRDKYSYDPQMHVNEHTPRDLRKKLEGFKHKVWCDDGSANVISLLTKRFIGADIWAIVKMES